MTAGLEFSMQGDGPLHGLASQGKEGLKRAFQFTFSFQSSTFIFDALDRERATPERPQIEGCPGTHPAITGLRNLSGIGLRGDISWTRAIVPHFVHPGMSPCPTTVVVVLISKGIDTGQDL